MSEVKVLDNGNVLVTVPVSFRFQDGRKRLIFPGNDSLEIDPLAMNLAGRYRAMLLFQNGAQFIGGG